MSNPRWEEFVELYYERIFNFCRQFLGDYEEAQDVTQQVFSKCFASLPSLKDPQREKSWIYSIARNCCIDRKRWYKRYLSWFDGTVEEKPAARTDPDMQLTLRKLISELPRQQREVFILRHLQDFSTEETAQLLKVSQGTVKTQLKRAVDKLKIALQAVDNQSAAPDVLEMRNQ